MTEAIRVFYATNRNHMTTAVPNFFGDRFSHDGPANLAFGRADVSGENLDSYDVQISGENLRAEIQILGSAEVFERARKKMVQKARDTVLLIHGFNTTFPEALTSAAKLKRNFSVDRGGPGINVAVFSWPSNGSLVPFLDYWDDRQEAAASGQALARGLLKLKGYLRSLDKEAACKQRIHIVAHSMGVFVLRHAVQHMVASGAAPGWIVDQVLLMAGDEDADALAQADMLYPLSDIAAGVTVYCNNNDGALAISDVTKGNPNRLGQGGPLRLESLPTRAVTVDCTDIIDGNDHSYHLEHPDVIADMVSVISGIPGYQIKGREWIDPVLRYRLGEA